MSQMVCQFYLDAANTHSQFFQMTSCEVDPSLRKVLLEATHKLMCSTSVFCVPRLRTPHL